jgi:predicted lipid-binding transport protein (Tim44 family)
VTDEPINDVEPSRMTAAKEDAANGRRRGIAGLKEIQAANKNFDADDFLQGASAAFEMIIETFAAATNPLCAPLLSDDVYDDFTSAIKAREDSGNILENSWLV